MHNLYKQSTSVTFQHPLLHVCKDQKKCDEPDFVWSDCFPFCQLSLVSKLSNNSSCLSNMNKTNSQTSFHAHDTVIRVFSSQSQGHKFNSQQNIVSLSKELFHIAPVHLAGKKEQNMNFQRAGFAMLGITLNLPENNVKRTHICGVLSHMPINFMSRQFH